MHREHLGREAAGVAAVGRRRGRRLSTRRRATTRRRRCARRSTRGRPAATPAARRRERAVQETGLRCAGGGRRDRCGDGAVCERAGGDGTNGGVSRRGGSAGCVGAVFVRSGSAATATESFSVGVLSRDGRCGRRRRASLLSLLWLRLLQPPGACAQTGRRRRRFRTCCAFFFSSSVFGVSEYVEGDGRCMYRRRRRGRGRRISSLGYFCARLQISFSVSAQPQRRWLVEPGCAWHVSAVNGVCGYPTEGNGPGVHTVTRQ